MRIAFLGACTVLLSQVWAQIPPGGVKTAEFASLPIRIRGDSEVSVRWKLAHAELRESVIGVWGALGVENVAPLTMNWARFYAEYFDASGMTGRACITDDGYRKTVCRSAIGASSVETIPRSVLGAFFGLQ